jgi:UDP-GlcNAc:undecaprenyl-phosphate/decaprenyl-phosphate GlcNAc-1-phosphate transferase
MSPLPPALLAAAAFVLPGAVSWLLTALLIRAAPRLGLVDYPGARKVHARPTPKGGGLAVYAAVAVAACLEPGGLDRRRLLLLGVGLGVVVLGLADDLRPLPWQFRLAVQTAAALAAVFLWPGDAGWPARLLGAFWVVALLNALNMLDNMDALSGSVAWIGAGFLAAALALRPPADATRPALPFLMLMGALAGFLWFNRPPARIFLGDAGSTFLGFFLGLGSLDLGFAGAGVPWSWAVPLGVLAVPCYDMTSVVLIRLRQGRSPFHADKQHLSHRLVAAGLSPPAAVGVIDLLALASGAGGLVIHEAATWTAAVLAGGQVVCWWAAVAAVEYGLWRRR